MSIQNINGAIYAYDGTDYVMVGNEKMAIDANLKHAISIHDLTVGRGQEVNITSPYSTGTAGSNSLVHPSIIRHSRGVDGSPYLMAVTPFADADDTTENPCIYVSDDLLTWRVPEGVTNPIVAQPAAGYNSDVHLYEHTDGYTYLLWRQYESGADATIYASRSYDCIEWTVGFPILTDVAVTQDWASPSLFHDGTSWIIISHDIANANIIRRLAKTGDLFMSWMDVTPTTLANSHPNSLTWWHSDIRRLPSGRLLALAFDGAAGGGPSIGPGGAGAGWLWQSDDEGVTWSVRKILGSKTGYRSSLIIDGSSIKMMLVWVDAIATGVDPTYTFLALHPLLPGRIENRRRQAVLQSIVTYSISIEDSPSVLVLTESFAGGAADLTAPWTQVTGTAMRRNGSGVGVAAGTDPAAAVVDCGSTDHWAQVTLAAYTAGVAGLVAKYVDASNYVFMGIPAATGYFSVQAIVADVAVINEKFLLTPTLAAGIVVRAVVDGLLLRIYVNGVLCYERALPADLATGASAGIYCSGSTASTFDVFACGPM